MEVDKPKYRATNPKKLERIKERMDKSIRNWAFEVINTDVQNAPCGRVLAVLVKYKDKFMVGYAVRLKDGSWESSDGTSLPRTPMAWFIPNPKARLLHK